MSIALHEDGHTETKPDAFADAFAVGNLHAPGDRSATTSGWGPTGSSTSRRTEPSCDRASRATASGT